MSQLRVYEFAKEVNMETLSLMDKLKEWKIPVKNHMAALDEETMGLIKKKLDEEKGASATKKKKAKKKTATKKKKAAKKKTATKKKTVTKKKATTKKKTSESKPVKRKVIRRKAADLKSSKEAAAAKAKAEEVETQDTQPKEEKATKEEPKTKRNIVGKIDLSKVTPPPGAKTSGNKSSTGGGARNIRTGFVAAPIDPFAAIEEENRRKELEEQERERERKKRAAKNTEEKTQFSASDFRKREIIFQPKKKKNLTSREGAKKTQITVPKAHKRVIKIHDSIQVADFAQQMGVKTAQLTKHLIKEGLMLKPTDYLDFDTASLIAPEFKYEVENIAKTAEDIVKAAAFGDVEAEMVERAPVVTVMGHVDHGKTSLLDAIRNADVASGEAGGITQHIGAYRVKLESGQFLTFIDTPGHAAFTEMRARGANVTDIVILVVAADDGVMPQTVEALNHAKSADVPIIVAVNKIDKPGANPDKIKQQLAEYELLPEDWGGTTIFCDVSAKERTGITELLEQVMLVAEVQELKANPKRSATGVVIESRMEKGRGVVATLLVQDGTLESSQYVVAGTTYGRIRSMLNDRGKVIKKAGPGIPVEILGLNEAPLAGDPFDVCESERAAEQIVEKRIEDKKKAEATSGGVSLENLFAKMQDNKLKELPLILKTDVAGTGEAVKAMLDKLSTDEVKVKILHNAVGAISESDVLLAQTSGGMIVGFNVRPTSSATKVAKDKGVEIKSYSIIYELADDIKAAMSGLLDPDVVEKVLGEAEVRETFSVPKVGTIAGCAVKDGKIVRSAMVRLIRDGVQIYEGKISSLKRFKDDAKEVASGYECGIGIENYNDIKVGDVIEAFTKEEIKREL